MEMKDKIVKARCGILISNKTKVHIYIFFRRWFLMYKAMAPATDYANKSVHVLYSNDNVIVCVRS